MFVGIAENWQNKEEYKQNMQMVMSYDAKKICNRARTGKLLFFSRE